VTVDEEARVVVGADGRNSIVARTVEPEEYNVHEPTTVAYYSFFSGVEMAAHELHYNGRHAMFAFPTNDGLVCLAIEAPYERRDEVRADPEGYMRRAMAEYAPELAARVAPAKREETMYGMLGRKSLYRKPYGAGWVLVGDAGFLKDPVTGRGVDDAFRDAEQAGDALDSFLTGRVPFGDAMSGFQDERDAATAEAYAQTCFLAEMHEVTPEFLQAMAGAPAG
jgi:flavin-dependent dehydrogenase